MATWINNVYNVLYVLVYLKITKLEINLFFLIYIYYVISLTLCPIELQYIHKLKKCETIIKQFQLIAYTRIKTNILIFSLLKYNKYEHNSVQ